MESVYHQTNRLVLETQQCFHRLEGMKGYSTESLEAEIQSRIDSINSNCEQLYVLLHKEPVSKRQNAKIRVDQLKYDNQHLQAALRGYQNEMFRRKQAEREREELLSRKFIQNPTLEGDGTSIFIDHSLQHSMALNNAHAGVDDLLKSGANILDSFRYQRDTLKGAHRRIIDIANTLGLSNTTLRLIEKRVSEDKYVLIGGLVVTCVIITLSIIYLS